MPEPPTTALSLSPVWSGGPDDPVGLRVTYTYVGPQGGESTAAPAAELLQTTTGASISGVNVDMPTFDPPSDALWQIVYVAVASGSPDAPVWGPWERFTSYDLSEGNPWSNIYDAVNIARATFPYLVDPPAEDEYGWHCILPPLNQAQIQSRSGDGSTPAWQTYLWTYTFVDASGHETPAAVISQDDYVFNGFQPITSSQWLTWEELSGHFPSGVAKVRWYVNPGAGSPMVWAGWRVAGEQDASAGPPGVFTLSVATADAAPSVSLPTANATCVQPADWLQLVHANRQGRFRTTGDTSQVCAGGVVQEQWPYATLAVTPATLMGQDPATGLPAYCPAPEPVLVNPAPKVVVPVDPLPDGTDPCVGARCGAALAMAAHLQQIYNQWQGWINGALTATAGAAVSIILDWLAAFLEALVVAERIASWVLTVFKNIRPTLNGLSVGALGGVLPTWDTATVNNVQQVFFCALQCQNGVVSVSAGDMNNVAQFMLHNTDNFLGNNVSELLALICMYSSLADWQAIITSAPASNLCNGYSCA